MTISPRIASPHIRCLRSAHSPLQVMLLILSVAACGRLLGDEPTAEVDYVRDVKPILAERCLDCHGPETQESELRLDVAAAILEGGNVGPAIAPRKPENSLLWKVVRNESELVPRMPPEDYDDPLSAQEIEILRKWIEQGAPHPSSESRLPDARRSSDHWSFQPVERPPLPDLPPLQDTQLPETQLPQWMNNPIDAFVLSRLREHDITPSPQADRTTLIRRVYLDLIGLPPSREEVEAFLEDDQPGAYERVVDRLLASPHYGERWGRHWLDQARYADSDGYTNDVARVMWKYRDWVIDALNRDLPFDQFTVQQLAGDMLPHATAEQHIASGFHRNTQRNREGGSDAEQYRVEAVVDRVSTTGVVFMGLTLGCARCHDHKYDPISQRDFYEMFAFLNNQDEPQYTVALDRPEAEQLVEAKSQLTDARHAENTKRVTELEQQVKRLSDVATTSTLVMRERSAPRETYIHIRGDFLRKGRSVSADVPDVLPALELESKGSTGEADSVPQADRLDLARWLVDSRNPLTPRVTANRIWQHFFGRGIVETENDFGAQGMLPTHPELLDYLAFRFREGNWSVKALQRLIVTSATYRQSSVHRDELHRVDPRNKLLARQNRLRLEAEIIRDSALAASGLLSKKLKGPSVFPPQPAGVMKMTRNPNRKWNVSPGADRYRRGMYTYFWRSTPHPFLKLFNAPESNTTCTRRDRSNTPLQALTLLNDEAFVEAARALAARVLSETKGEEPAVRIRHAFQLCLARAPSPQEEEGLVQLLAAELDAAQADSSLSQEAAPVSKAAPLPSETSVADALAWTSIARTLLNLDEFITRE